MHFRSATPNICEENFIDSIYCYSKDEKPTINFRNKYLFFFVNKYLEINNIIFNGADFTKIGDTSCLSDLK